jgi:hypothetical protein
MKKIKLEKKYEVWIFFYFDDFPETLSKKERKRERFARKYFNLFEKKHSEFEKLFTHNYGNKNFFIGKKEDFESLGIDVNKINNVIINQKGDYYVTSRELQR